ncbi:PEGA domain-containing protein [Aggregicoccus sp. 17bor-14]|nr:PEGA domain-containing protein [Aggregicoccus sp. 17bor-14]
MAAAAALLGACASAPPGPSATVARARGLLEGSRSARGNVVLRCTPREAEVVLDGVPQGLCSDFEAASAALTLGEGLHSIEVRREGYWPYTTYVEPNGARTTLRAVLRPSSGGAAAAQAGDAK